MNKKFKLIKSYPNCAWDIGDIVSSPRGCQYLYEDLIQGMFSEFWQEIKESLFITEDGVEIFDKNTNVYFMRNDFTGYNMTFSYYKNQGIIFSSKEAAEKYIEDNKPRFSKKQIEETLDHTMFTYYSTKHIDYLLFKQKLGI